MYLALKKEIATIIRGLSLVFTDWQVCVCVCECGVCCLCVCVGERAVVLSTCLDFIQILVIFVLYMQFFILIIMHNWSFLLSLYVCELGSY